MKDSQLFSDEDAKSRGWCYFYDDEYFTRQSVAERLIEDGYDVRVVSWR